ncbi:MAG: hypothetical protein V4793_29270 [Paraburkholderia tropica]|uniref:Uncharacterized protein n=1 Tax=Paraburkholderia tropica TaxID=92647 RepID=A0AAQ1JXS4_9BURK|nr:hypothetical protein [Paraburkholderia tropica]MBB2984257.1 hypothetical protein [Paraburkholderia tropica]MBB3005000.1 hypothetical protein [Paraburkholderia tropica]MBB6323288.1 hypothetical protein [Paraburkholderia tropica]PXX05084.1 hypothetical protein C7400_14451 [Paraburkholderia tropica]PZW70512.1 hypothetical protein C7399_14451 [Paraburkholderia tropica]
MSNVIPLRTEDEASELERRLATRFGIKTAQLHAAIKPLFLLMHDHDIGNVSISRDGTKAVVTVDGESL